MTGSLRATTSAIRPSFAIGTPCNHLYTRPLAYIAARPITNTAVALRPNTPSASINTADSTPSTTNPVTRIAQQGSNQLSLETPRNGAGKLAMRVRDRQLIIRIRSINIGQGCQLGSTGIDVAHDFRFGMLCRRDDAHGSCTI